MTLPNRDDVVVRPRRGTRAYALGTPSSLDQFIFLTREEADRRALAFAKNQHVRAWFASGEDDFVLLGTFQPDEKPD